MKKARKEKTKTVLGYLLFFMVIAVTVTVAMFIYGLADKLSNGNTAVISVWMLVGIIVLSLLCTLFDIVRRKKMVDKPVNEILSATEKLTSGDFSVRLTPKHPFNKYDEFDLIKENLNAMASELGKSEILKTDFIANVSHEIKTPLSIIKNYVQLIGQDNLDEQTKKAYIETVITATTRLNDLVGNILKLNKLENSSLTIAKTKVRLDEMLAQVVISFEDIIERKCLEVDCDFEEITIETESSYLEIVWNNLISNAIKFTDNGGKISVSVKKDGENAVVSVTDTGCGISAQTGQRIFDKFYQGDTSRAKEGNGLGLALVKKVIDLIGGEISVKSQVGKGSTFIITLKG